MEVNKDMVKRVASLCRLDLEEEELEELSTQMADIIRFVNQLSELDTEKVEPYIHNIDSTPMRDDIIGTTLDREKVLRNAPQREGGFFVVPKIVEI